MLFTSTLNLLFCNLLLQTTKTSLWAQHFFNKNMFFGAEKNERRFSYRFRTAFRTGQPLPFCQRLHQSHYSHLTLRGADHVEEALRGRGQGQVTKAKKLFVTLLLCHVKLKNTTPIKWGQYSGGICRNWGNWKILTIMLPGVGTGQHMGGILPLGPQTDTVCHILISVRHVILNWVSFLNTATEGVTMYGV